MNDSPMIIDTNLLPESNFLKVLKNRERYNNNGVLRFGFTGVFCYKSEFHKMKVFQDIVDFSERIIYNDFINITHISQFNFQLRFPPKTLIVIDSNIFKNEKGNIIITDELRGLFSTACSLQLSVILLMDGFDPFIAQSADFIWITPEIKYNKKNLLFSENIHILTEENGEITKSRKEKKTKRKAINYKLKFLVTEEQYLSAQKKAYRIWHELLNKEPDWAFDNDLNKDHYVALNKSTKPSIYVVSHETADINTCTGMFRFPNERVANKFIKKMGTTLKHLFPEAKHFN